MAVMAENIFRLQKMKTSTRISLVAYGKNQNKNILLRVRRPLHLPYLESIEIRLWKEFVLTSAINMLPYLENIKTRMWKEFMLTSAMKTLHYLENFKTRMWNLSLHFVVGLSSFPTLKNCETTLMGLYVL